MKKYFMEIEKQWLSHLITSQSSNNVGFDRNRFEMFGKLIAFLFCVVFSYMNQP